MSSNRTGIRSVNPSLKETTAHKAVLLAVLVNLMPRVGIGHSLGSYKYYRYKGHGSDPCKTKTQHKQFFILLVPLQAAKASSSVTTALSLPQGSPGRSAGKLHFNSNSFASVQHAFTLLKVAYSIAVSLKGKWSLFLCQTWHQHTYTVAQQILLDHLMKLF